MGKGPHMSLTENRLKALKPKDKAYKVADERGLYVEVTPVGSKLWRFRYRVGKIEKKLRAHVGRSGGSPRHPEADISYSGADVRIARSFGQTAP